MWLRDMLADILTGSGRLYRDCQGAASGELIGWGGCYKTHRARDHRIYEQYGLTARTLLANGRGSRHVSDPGQFLIPRTEITWDQRRVHST